MPIPKLTHALSSIHIHTHAHHGHIHTLMHMHPSYTYLHNRQSLFSSTKHQVAPDTPFLFLFSGVFPFLNEVLCQGFSTAFSPRTLRSFGRWLTHARAEARYMCWNGRSQNRLTVFDTHCSSIPPDQVYELPGGEELFSPYLRDL